MNRVYRKILFGILLAVLPAKVPVCAKVSMPAVSRSRYIAAGTLKAKGKKWAYKDKNLKKRTRYALDCSTAQVKIIKINGDKSVQAIYTDASGRKRSGWFARAVFTKRRWRKSGAVTKLAAGREISVYKHMGDTARWAVIAKESKAYVIKGGDLPAEWTQALYRSGKHYVMGFVRTAELLPVPGVTDNISLETMLNTEFVAAAPGGSHGKKTNVYLRQNTLEKAQQFRLEQKNGYFMIVHKGSGKVLGLSGSSPRNGKNVRLCARKGVSSQYWKLVYDGKGVFHIQCKKKDKSGRQYYLAVRNGTAKNKARICVKRLSSGKAQKWKIRERKNIKGLIHASGYKGAYDGKKHTVAVKADHLNKYTVFYSKKKLTASNYKTGSRTAPARAGVGTVKVYYYLKDRSGVYASASGAVSIKITRADPALAFQSNAVTKTKGDPAFTNMLNKKTGAKVTYSSSNSKVAAVNKTSGKVTIKKAGTAVIRADAAKNRRYKAGSASYHLTVVEKTTAAARFADIAHGEVGYQGKNQNGAAAGNYTKYGEWMNQNGVAWCAQFVSWCAYKAGVSEQIIPRTASTQVMAASAHYKIWNSQTLNVLKKGDVLFFAPVNGNISHMGIVYARKDNRLTVISGNTTRDRVEKQTYTVDKTTGKITKGWEGYRFTGYIPVSG